MTVQVTVDPFDAEYRNRRVNFHVVKQSELTSSYFLSFWRSSSCSSTWRQGEMQANTACHPRTPTKILFPRKPRQVSSKRGANSKVVMLIIITRKRREKSLVRSRVWTICLHTVLFTRSVDFVFCRYKLTPFSRLHVHANDL